MRYIDNITTAWYCIGDLSWDQIQQRRRVFQPHHPFQPRWTSNLAQPHAPICEPCISTNLFQQARLEAGAARILTRSAHNWLKPWKTKQAAKKHQAVAVIIRALLRLTVVLYLRRQQWAKWVIRLHLPVSQWVISRRHAKKRAPFSAAAVVPTPKTRKHETRKNKKKRGNKTKVKAQKTVDKKKKEDGNIQFSGITVTTPVCESDKRKMTPFPLSLENAFWMSLSSVVKIHLVAEKGMFGEIFTFTRWCGLGLGDNQWEAFVKRGLNLDISEEKRKIIIQSWSIIIPEIRLWLEINIANQTIVEVAMKSMKQQKHPLRAFREFKRVIFLQKTGDRRETFASSIVTWKSEPHLHSAAVLGTRSIFSVPMFLEINSKKKMYTTPIVVDLCALPFAPYIPEWVAYVQATLWRYANAIRQAVRRRVVRPFLEKRRRDNQRMDAVVVLAEVGRKFPPLTRQDAQILYNLLEDSPYLVAMLRV